MRPRLPHPDEGGWQEYCRLTALRTEALLINLPPITHRPFDWSRDGSI